MEILRSILSIRAVILVSCCWAFCLPAKMNAQNIGGAISGTVFDSTQRPLPGADITVWDTQRETRHRDISDDGGAFHFTGLTPGSYRLEVNLPGFEQHRTEDIKLRVGQSLNFQIQLVLKGMETSVEVSTQTLQMVDNKQSESFGTAEMNDLPVSSGGAGRNFYAQARTAPGVALSTLAHRPFAVSGQRPRNNNYMVDSVEMNDAVSGFIAGRAFTEQLVSQETIQSFEIITHNFKAEYGRNSGGIVNVVTKSGANEVHGSFYNYHNNSALSARNPLATNKNQFLSNHFGFTVGGPVQKDRFFFFGNLEFFRPRGTSLATFRTLTDVERARAVPSVRPLADMFPRAAGSNRVLTQGVPNRVDGRTYLIRADYLLSNDQKFTFRTNFTRGETESTAIGNTVNSDVTILNKTRSFALQLQSVLSPSVINELRFGYLRLQQKDSNFDDPILLGDPKVNGEVGFLIVPGLSLGGPLPFLGRNQTQNTFQYSDDLSWVRGNHILKVGSSVRRVQVNGGSINNSFIGTLFFPGIEAFLAGQPLSFNRNFGNPVIGLRRTEWHTYIQDDWKILPNLTLNLGLRYELNTSPDEAVDRISQEFLFRGDHNNFAPRLGFAWNFMPKTVLRGGYGIFYNAVEMAFIGLTRFNPPLVENLSAFRPTLPNLLERASTSIPSGLVVPDREARTPYAQHISLALERQLWNPQSSVTAAYVGTLGRKLSRNLRPNGGDNLAQQARPDPSVGVVNRLENSANSNYHALQVSLRQQFSNRFSLRSAYTYSRFIDDVSEIPERNTGLERNLVPLDSDNLALDRGLSDFDIRHIFTLSYLYDLPFFQGSRWFGGWTLSGITTLQSGRPFTIFSGTDTPTGTNNNRILDLGGTLIRDFASANPVRLSEGVFAATLIPEPGALGTLGRNTERGDSLLTWNVSLSKDVRLTEDINLQIRGEIFNLFNTTNFDKVDNILTSPSFGRTLSAFDPRRVQVALRLTF